MRRLFLLFILLTVAEANSINVKKLVDKHTKIAKERTIESPETASVKADTKNYGKNRIAIIVRYRLQSNSHPYEYDYLSLYEEKENKVQLLLADFKLSSVWGEKSSCDYYKSTHKYQYNKSSDSSRIIFEHSYSYSHEEFCKEMETKKWEVKLEPKVLLFKKGKYIKVSKKEKVLFNEKVFDLDEVYQSVKKGLKYRKLILEAMLFEEQLSQKNVQIYAEIASELYVHKHKKEATFLLDAIFRSGIEFIKTGIYADVSVYDYLSTDFQDDIRLMDARDMSLDK